MLSKITFKNTFNYIEKIIFEIITSKFWHAQNILPYPCQTRLLCQVDFDYSTQIKWQPFIYIYLEVEVGYNQSHHFKEIILDESD